MLGGFGGKGFGGGFGGSDGIQAFNLGGPEGALKLALMILKTAEKDHNAGVEIACGIRDMILSMAVAIALVTGEQNPEQPLIAISPEEADGNAEAHHPGEMLQALCDGFDVEETRWQELVDHFHEGWIQVKADEIIRGMQKDFSVSDILGENDDRRSEIIEED